MDAAETKDEGRGVAIGNVSCRRLFGSKPAAAGAPLRF